MWWKMHAVLKNTGQKKKGPTKKGWRRKPGHESLRGKRALGHLKGRKNSLLQPQRWTLDLSNANRQILQTDFLQRCWTVEALVEKPSEQRQVNSWVRYYKGLQRTLRICKAFETRREIPEDPWKPLISNLRELLETSENSWGNPEDVWELSRISKNSWGCRRTLRGTEGH